MMTAAGSASHGGAICPEPQRFQLRADDRGRELITGAGSAASVRGAHDFSARSKGRFFD